MVRGFKKHKNAKAAMLFAFAAFYRLYFMFLKKDCANYCRCLVLSPSPSPKERGAEDGYLILKLNVI